MSATTKTTAALLALSLSACASHPILRDTLIAVAVASVVASHPSTEQPDGRKAIPSDPCAHVEQCR